jgi:hypothetical protein
VTGSTAINDALTFGTATVSTAPEDDGAVVGTGLGAKPGTSLYANKDLPIFKQPGEKPAPEEKAWYEKAWDAVKEAVTPDSGTNTGGTDGGGKGGATKPGTWVNSYDNPDADGTGVAGGDAVLTGVVLQTVATGIDPTTTTPSGPYVDDGGAEPITADDIAGAPAVGGFNVPIRPGVLDGSGELQDLTPTAGAPGVFVDDVNGPDTVNPNDPMLDAPEPITAADLTSPHPSTTSITGDAFAGGDELTMATGNTVADTGGEDEDLEDLELQQFTAGNTTTRSIAVEAFDGGDQLAPAGDLSEARLISALPAFDGPEPSGDLEPFDDGLFDG